MPKTTVHLTFSNLKITSNYKGTFHFSAFQQGRQSFFCQVCLTRLPQFLAWTNFKDLNDLVAIKYLVGYNNNLDYVMHNFTVKGCLKINENEYIQRDYTKKLCLMYLVACFLWFQLRKDKR